MASLLRNLLLLVLVASSLIATATAHPAEDSRLVWSLDSKGWKFALGDPPGAEKAAFNDSTWRPVDVPHDWSIEGPFSETNRAGGAGAFLPAGIGWYRLPLSLQAPLVNRKFFVQFDGVMANSDVWLNGFHLGHRPYGYSSFQYNLTGHLEFGPGKTNCLAVRADNSSQPASRWYAGAGIHRHVRLVATAPVHLEHWATFVTTPAVTPDRAIVRVKTTVLNESEATREIAVRFEVLAPNGQHLQSRATSLQPLAPASSADFQQEFTVTRPVLWDITTDRAGQGDPWARRVGVAPSGDPSLASNTPLAQPLYCVSAKVLSGDDILDEENTPFGIREARFEPATGFWLNGRNLKLKGVCLHHDAGALGAAVPLRAWERRLELLQEVGCNAIRTAHNPPSPEFLALCDRMGFLVLDETFDCWTVGKNPYDYHRDFKEWSKIDTRDMVLRDRNHPCVIAYSAGNEIRDTPQPESARKTLAGLVEVFHQNDPSRPVTQALFRPNVSHDYDNGLADLLDVVGQNYREDEILAAHAAKPERKIVGTENGHDRRVWLALRDHPPYAGQFLWTGFDYLGESRRWPVIGAGSGLFDRTGAPHPRAFERQSWWSDQSMVHMVRRVEPARATADGPGFAPLARRQMEFSDWTPRNTEPHEETVEVYSNCERVELLLNGKSLGSKPLPTDASPRTWKVAFEPGRLQAVGKNQNKTIANHELRTASKPARILLSSDCVRLTPDWDDLAYVTATVVDTNDVPVPDAADLITFQLSGPGRIVAVDSGNNSSHEPFQASARHAFQGQCIVIARATVSSGRITLTASAPSLGSATAVLDAAASATEK
jgi:beta-galactosidase